MLRFRNWSCFSLSTCFQWTDFSFLYCRRKHTPHLRWSFLTNIKTQLHSINPSILGPHPSVKFSSLPTSSTPFSRTPPPPIYPTFIKNTSCTTIRSQTHNRNPDSGTTMKPAIIRLGSTCTTTLDPAGPTARSRPFRSGGAHHLHYSKFHRWIRTIRISRPHFI